MTAAMKEGFAETPEEAGYDLSNPQQKQDWETALRRSEARRKFVTPGGPGLDPLGLRNRLLEERRLKFGIPDGCFRAQPMYDCVTVWQLPVTKARIGSIIMPEETKQAQRETVPRGILLASGPAGLDHLKSNGCDVGHIVTFVSSTPWRTMACWIDGRPDWVLQMQAKHIRGSEDLRERMARGEVFIKEEENEKGWLIHRYVDRQTGKTWDPQMPWGDIENP